MKRTLLTFLGFSLLLAHSALAGPKAKSDVKLNATVKPKRSIANEMPPHVRAFITSEIDKMMNGEWIDLIRNNNLQGEETYEGPSSLISIATSYEIGGIENIWTLDYGKSSRIQFLVYFDVEETLEQDASYGTFFRRYPYKERFEDRFSVIDVHETHKVSWFTRYADPYVKRGKESVFLREEFRNRQTSCESKKECMPGYTGQAWGPSRRQGQSQGQAPSQN